MAKTKLTLYLGEQDEELQEWYRSIPLRYRNMMVRLTLYNALHHGLADVGQLFPGMRQPGQTAITASTKERITTTEVAPVASPLGNRQGAANLKDPKKMSTEELIAFTVANLPPDTPPHLVELAKKFYSITPYTKERLAMLAEVEGAGAQIDPAETSTEE